jgi:pSer/pThr/pTyr-binding forkhead associated (FHA) protein
VFWSVDPKTPQGYSEPERVASPVRAPIQPRDEFRTMGIGFGQELRVSQKLLMVQFSDGVGKWRELEQVRAEGHVVGRQSFHRVTSSVEFLAADHLRISVEDDRVFVEEGETLNGVYLKVPAGRPVELRSGTRFQVGQHVIEFQLPEAAPVDDEVIKRDQERLRWRKLEPMAYLVFAGPDGGPGVRFPLTKVAGTVIGREGDISLTGDTWSSRSHARVVRDGDRFFLEDLDSTNGTFVRISGRTPIKTGNFRDMSIADVLLLGSVLVRIIEM